MKMKMKIIIQFQNVNYIYIYTLKEHLLNMKINNGMLYQPKKSSHLQSVYEMNIKYWY